MKLAGILSSCRCSGAAISWWTVWSGVVYGERWTHAWQRKGLLPFCYFLSVLSFFWVLLVRLGNLLGWLSMNFWLNSERCFKVINAVACCLLFQFVNELVRVAAPGGTIIIVTWCHRDLSPSEESLKPKEKELLRKICDAYYLPAWCSTADYVKLLESLSLQVLSFIL